MTPFNNEKYIRIQSEHIKERIAQFGNKLYLELGGKLFDDYHASRVLPGFQPDSKLTMLTQLRDTMEIVIVISAADIEKNKVRQDLGITYDVDVLRLREEFMNQGFLVNSVVITHYSGQASAQNYSQRLERLGIKTYFHYTIEGYPHNVALIDSADGFGKFGALDVVEDWADEARRYYIGIVGKYGAQVQSLLKKAAGLDIRTICSLHGPVLTENLGYYINLYDTWSSYRHESEGVVICYTSVYGNTKKAVLALAEKLKEKGCPKVVVTDLARDDMAEAVEDAFRYGKLVLATTTYNGDVFPFMKEFIHHLTERGYRNRTIGLMENGSFTLQIARVIAVFIPCIITGLCLLLMFCSRRMTYPWLISIFSLVLPLFFLPSLAALIGSVLIEPMFKPYMPVEEDAA